MPSLQDQVAEVDLILASTSDDEFRWSGSADEVATWKELISIGSPDTSDKAPPLCYALKLSAGEGSEQVWVNVNHSHDDNAEPSLTLRAPHVSKERLDGLHAVIQQRREAAAKEEFGNVVFDIFTALQEYMSTNAEEMLLPDIEPKMEAQDALQRTVDMSRVIFWSHHLKAPSKKRDMTAWCSELSLWGLVKSGYPAYLCFEGQKDDVQVIVKRIKALQWHAITVRTEEPYLFQASPSCSTMQDVRDEALQHCLLAKGHSAESTVHHGKLRTTMDEVESGKELVARLKLANVPEAEYRSAMNL